MDKLIELVSTISKYKIKQIEIIGNQQPGAETKFQELYDVLKNNKSIQDSEVFATLYPDQTATDHIAYKRLKSRFSDRLINTLFFIDANSPHFSDRESAFYTCHKNWLAIRILMSRNARKVGIELAEKTIRISLKFEFTELTLFLAKELRFHYSLAHSNKRKHSQYSSIINKANQELQAELVAEDYYTAIMSQFGRTQQPTEEILLESKELSEDLSNRYTHIRSFRFIRISYLLHIVRFQINNQFDEAIHACEEAIDIICKKPYESKGAVFSFENRLLSCYVQLKQFCLGQKLAEKHRAELKTGTYDWYAVMLYYYILCTHSRNYDKSHEVASEALSHSAFRSLYPNMRQLWLIIQAFDAFLVLSGYVENPEDNKSSFRLYRFLNNIPIFAKDKRGINIAVLIIHVLILLQQKKFDSIVDRVDALNQYCHRYLRKDDTFRANCFIKMLLQVPRANFNRLRTERYAQKYVQRLALIPLNVSTQGIEVEIVPYEDLWDIVLTLLE